MPEFNYWCYRTVLHKSKKENPDFIEYLTVHETHYHNSKPSAFTSKPSSPSSLDEANNMVRAFSIPPVAVIYDDTATYTVSPDDEYEWEWINNEPT